MTELGEEPEAGCGVSPASGGLPFQAEGTAGAQAQRREDRKGSECECKLTSQPHRAACGPLVPTRPGRPRPSSKSRGHGRLRTWSRCLFSAIRSTLKQEEGRQARRRASRSHIVRNREKVTFWKSGGSESRDGPAGQPLSDCIPTSWNVTAGGAHEMMPSNLLVSQRGHRGEPRPGEVCPESQSGSTATPGAQLRALWAPLSSPLSPQRSLEHWTPAR